MTQAIATDVATQLFDFWIYFLKWLESRVATKPRQSSELTILEAILFGI